MSSEEESAAPKNKRLNIDKQAIISTFREAALMIVYELIGTFLLTFLIANYYSQASKPVCVAGVPSTFGYQGCQTYDVIGLYVGIFVTILFSLNISGSHFNPLVTLSLMFGSIMDGKRFDKLLGLFYILA